MEYQRQIDTLIREEEQINQRGPLENTIRFWLFIFCFIMFGIYLYGAISQNSPKTIAECQIKVALGLSFSITFCVLYSLGIIWALVVRLQIGGDNLLHFILRELKYVFTVLIILTMIVWFKYDIHTDTCSKETNDTMNYAIAVSCFLISGRFIILMFTAVGSIYHDGAKRIYEILIKYI